MHLCLYCGQPTKRGKRGEHIVPEAAGGVLTLNDVSNRRVCPKCNSGILSQLDKELCSRSFLSVIASREIGAHLWQAWDVDHQSNNLLVEAKPAWAAEESLTSLVCYPQIVFERSGPQVYGDPEEFRRFGHDAGKVLFLAARHAYRRYREGEKGAINFERVRSGVILDGYRLPPRIFTPHAIEAVARNIETQSFVLRFTSESDKLFALRSFANLNDGSQLQKWTYKPSSQYPEIGVFFDIGDTMRALMKIGLNLIAAYCPNTPVDHNSFAGVIRVIRGEVQFPPRILMSNGFVHPEDVAVINAAEKAHSFRLVHIDGVWRVYFSFFGGQVGACVHVPGPNHEKWAHADIVAPIGSKDWTIKTSSILLCMKDPCVEWSDGRVVIPSLKLQNTVSFVGVEPVKKKLP